MFWFLQHPWPCDWGARLCFPGTLTVSPHYTPSSGMGVARLLHTVWTAVTNTAGFSLKAFPAPSLCSHCSCWYCACFWWLSLQGREKVPKAGGGHTGSLLSGPTELGCPAIWATFMVVTGLRTKLCCLNCYSIEFCYCTFLIQTLSQWTSLEASGAQGDGHKK